MNVIETTDEGLEQLIDQLTMQLASDEEVDLEALVYEHPQHEQRLRLLFPAMCGMAQLSRQATDEGRRDDRPCGAEGDSDADWLPAIGDYKILREIGRGGMGVVYLARERTLHREVALKVLPLAALADRRQLARFHNEARAAAALHHSHVVPIYSVGVERGIHYYAMQYIAGPTLAQVLTELRDRDGDSPESHTDLTERPAREDEASSGSSSLKSEASTEPLGKIQTSIAARRSSSLSDYYRTVARWGIQVAEALAHAHEHGVVHRDIKPANLLLEDIDNIWITDFGLARLDVGATMTGSGDLLGTLRYMSPEQVAGHGTLVDHRTDVYSLGATLYEALTLRPAFVEQSRSELLRQIATKEPPPPRRLHSTIPVDLETIVLKAMEKDRSERYDTALELADDLRRFVENHPIQARRASLLQRMRKWGKRHMGLVLVSVLALILVSVTASLAAALIWRANEDTKIALADRDAALQRAHEKATLAMIAVDEMYEGVATRWIASDAELTALQRGFLDQAVEIYEQLAQETANDRFSRKEVAYAWQRISDIRYATGQWKEALASAERSIFAFDELLQADPDNVDLLHALGQLHSNSAILMRFMSRMEESEAANRKAAALFRRLANLEPEEIQHRLCLANTQLNLSRLLYYLGQFEDAERPARHAWQQATQMASENDNQDWFFSEVAFNAAGNLSNLLQETGRAGDAEQVCRQAVAECESLSLDRPEDRRVLRMLGSLRGQLGSILADLGNMQDAEAVIRTSLAALEKSLRYGDSPYNLFQASQMGELAIDEYLEPEPILSHALAQNSLGKLLRKLGRDDEAASVLEESTYVLEQMVVRYQETHNFKEALASGEAELARLLQEHDSKEAERRFRTALRLYRDLLETSRGVPENHVALSQVLSDLGSLMVAEGKHAEAQQLFESGIRHAETALEIRPDVPRAKDTLNDLRANLAQVAEVMQDGDKLQEGDTSATSSEESVE